MDMLMYELGGATAHAVGGYGVLLTKEQVEKIKRYIEISNGYFFKYDYDVYGGLCFDGHIRFDIAGSIEYDYKLYAFLPGCQLEDITTEAIKLFCLALENICVIVKEADMKLHYDCAIWGDE